MDEKQQQYFRQRLMAMQEEDQEASDQIAEKLRTPLSETTAEISLYDNHPADIGDETFERGKDLGFRLFWEDRLAMIRGALTALDEGTYGQCESCGRQISMERLEAVPYTTLCQDCKKDEEGLERHIRPIEEDVMALPFGGVQDTTLFQGSDTSENNAFDGEDAWQAVARFGTSDTPSDIGAPDISDYDDVYQDSWEDIGSVEDVEEIPVEIDEEGNVYQDFNGEDDETIRYNRSSKVQEDKSPCS